MSETVSPRSISPRRARGVLVSDMSDLSRTIGDAESRAVATAGRVREVFSRVVARHNGSLDVLAGECFVALFDGPVEAVRAAIAIQTDLAGALGPAGTALRIRIGIHVGDIVRSGIEIRGDSVTIAARL